MIISVKSQSTNLNKEEKEDIRTALRQMEENVLKPVRELLSRPEFANDPDFLEMEAKTVKMIADTEEQLSKQ